MAPPAPLKCQAPGCAYQTPAQTPTWEAMLTLLQLHDKNAHPVAVAAPADPAAPRLERLPRPVFSLNMSEAAWQFKVIEWNSYIGQTVCSPDRQLMQLRAACDEELRQRVYDTGDYGGLNTVATFLARMKELAVVKIHESVHLMNLYQMAQDSDEAIRAFVARVTGTADMCGMTLTCPREGCGTNVSYRDEVVKQVVIHGMRNMEIKQRVLSRSGTGELKTLAELVTYISAEESAMSETLRLSAPDSDISRIRQSSYKSNKSQSSPASPKCKFCGGARHTQANTAEDRQRLCKAFGKKCTNCQKLNHFASVCQSGHRTQAAPLLDTNDISTLTVDNLYDPETFVYPDSSLHPAKATDLLPVIGVMRGEGPVTSLPLPHHVHDVIQGWYQSRARDSPTLPVSFTIDKSAYAALGLAMPRLSHNASNRSRSGRATADTGAQLTVLPASLLENMGIKLESIFPVQSRLNGAQNAPIMVEGGILLVITATNPQTGVSKTSHQLCYVSRLVTSTFLSFSACIDLGLVPDNFPEVGSCDFTAPPASVQTLTSPSSPRCSNSGVPTSSSDSCSCPRRELPPETPAALPCAPTPENVPRLKQYILDRYKASAFNVCEHQPLRLMDGSPPLRIFVDEEARPVAVHSPSQIPLHWQQPVKDGLDRDVRLGVLEKVPVNDPVTWCSRMVITAKHDGSPRRVVDYTALNKHAPRQTHHTESPWSIVSSLPPDKVKSVLDCWHGYHSVPLHPADRHLTTFVTPWGRYRYRTCPQGLICAGDAYTQRKSEIMEGFENHKTCVDDSVIYDSDIEENFYRVCSFLERAAKGGCTFNPKKFQFGSSEVDFLGFRVTKDGIKPSQEFLDNIMSFPVPRSITDIRSWFGAINQISYSFAVAPVMNPFRHLLSSKVPFNWTPELQSAFDASKLEILRQCEAGVRSFDPNLPTALATDWAKFGMGFWLTQKHCQCPGSTPGCCQTGWQTVYVGSRFCSAAESRYHPIEGEALSAINGLDKCRFFVLGLPDLTLCLDHKPLLGIFGDKNNLETIENPRLLNFKMKSLLFRFKAVHVPGKKNVIPDTFSRRGDSPVSQSVVSAEYADSLGPPAWVSRPVLSAISADTEELLQGHVIASLALVNSQVTADSPTDIISWQRLESACLSCEEYVLLHSTIKAGVPEDKSAWDSLIQDYYPHRHSLVTSGPVVLLHDRPVIPRSLRPAVMSHLHAGHGSASAMFERASSSLYWPNFRQDLINHRAACRQCSRFAPSNPAMPPVVPEDPTYPFEHVCADFFQLGPKQTYLVIVCRFSNWINIVDLRNDNSANLITAMRRFISTYGIPVTITSDGAKVFTSREFEDFCSRFGIVHRVSSAYHPRANKRAELAVKHAKRVIRGNVSQTGSLDTDKVVQAMLIHRNTPCPITGLSPAQVVYGRVLRDALPLQPGKFHPRQDWRLAADRRADAYGKRKFVMQERLSRGSRHLPPLCVGDHVLVQDQHGNNPRQWNKSGVVVEVGSHDSYLISVGGSRQLTKRNRQFLRKIEHRQQSYADSEAQPDSPRLRPVTRATSTLSTTPPLASPSSQPPASASPSPTVSVSPPQLPAEPSPPPPTPPVVSQPGFRPLQPLPQPPVQPPPILPPLHVRDEFYPYGDGRIVAQQNNIRMFPPQPPVWPQNIPYSPFQAPAFPHQSLVPVNPAYTWPSHLPSYGQYLGGGDINTIYSTESSGISD